MVKSETTNEDKTKQFSTTLSKDNATESSNGNPSTSTADNGNPSDKTDSLQAQTRLTYSSDLTSDEKEQIYMIMKQIKQKNLKLPFHWHNGDTLRFLALSNNNIEETIKNIETHLEFLETMSTFKLTQAASKIIQDGNIYIGGRAKNGYPIMIISMKNIKIDAKNAPEAENALLFIIMTLKKYMLLGKHIESYHVFVDLDNKSPMGISMKFIKSLLSAISVNFCHRGGTTFIYNASWGFNITWKIIKGFQPQETLDFTKFIKKGEERMILDLVNEENWEMRFGGKMKDYNPSEFWPPKSFDREQNLIDKKFLLENDQHNFWILHDDKDELIWMSEAMESEKSVNEGLKKKRNEKFKAMMNNFEIEEKRREGSNGFGIIVEEKYNEDSFLVQGDFAKVGCSTNGLTENQLIADNQRNMNEKTWWDVLFCGCCKLKKRRKDS